MQMKITIKGILYLATAIVFGGCTEPAKQNTLTAAEASPVPPALNDEQSVMSVLYQQEAAEYRALCFQAYNLARLKLEKEIKPTSKASSLAVITDLDETALDNGSFYGELYKKNTTFDLKTNWTEWCKMEKADSIPGSVAFFKYADSKNVNVFYVSNRDTSLVSATMNNMKALGFPQLDRSHFLFRTNNSSKEERRKTIEGKYNVVLLLGDNLNDFSFIFEKKKIAERKSEVDQVKKNWGDRFIVLPNAIYGDWENALYNYDPAVADINQKREARVKLLRGYAAE